MERLLPKNDYFKTTTRRVMSEEQKRLSIAAIDRASAYLNRMSPMDDLDELHVGNPYQRLNVIRQRLRYLGRCVILEKGRYQPRRLYRHRRRMEVWNRARIIANETGRETDSIYDHLMLMMAKYVSEES